MTFPDDPIDVTVELGHIVTPGVWTDVTPYVLVRDGIVITRGRADEASQPAPQTATLTFDNQDGRFSPRNPLGAYYGKIGRNTPIQIKIGTSVRLVGEVSEWPPRWGVADADRYVPITASGIKRRLGQGTPSISSGFKAYILAQEPNSYWALDEGELAGYGRESTGDSRFYPYPASGSNKPTFKFAGSALAENLPPALQIFSTDPGAVGYSYLRGDVGSGDDTAVAVDFVYKSTTLGPLTLFAQDYNGNTWRLALRTGANDDVELAHVDTASGAVTSLANSGVLSAITDGELHHVRLLYEQNGADVDLTAYIDGVSVLTTTRAGTIMDGCSMVRFTYVPSGSETSVGLGHVAVWDDPAPDVAELALAMLGFAGETAANRVDRVCSEALVGMTIVGDPDTSTPMGPQIEGDLLAQVADGAAADMGSLYEPRDTLGLAYRTRESAYNQTPAVTIDYSADELSPPLEPTDDDQQTRNDVTAKREGGGTARYVVTEGALSTAEPPDGVGTYQTEVTVNVASDDQLPYVAGYLANLGSWDEPRYPLVRVDRATPPVAANATLSAALLDVDIDDLLVITGMDDVGVYDDVKLLVRGYTETIMPFSHVFEFNCSPARPYDVGVYASDVATTGSRYSPDDCELVSAITSSQTTLDVSIASGPLMSADDLPADIMVAGERMTVTAINADAVSFVGVGTGASGSNASVTPGLPAGVTVGDLVLIFASIRNSGTGTVNTPTNWTSLAAMSNAKVVARIYDGVWTMPTITFAGGAANEDTLAQSCAFRGVSHLPFIPRNSAILNASAQNIGTPGLIGGPSSLSLDARLIIWLGWKQDDWTSVATLNHPGAIEINERTSGLGLDASQVWDYKILTNPDEDIPARTFVVSGGAAAVSRGAVVSFGSGQRLTVTRSVNGVVKSHASGSVVELAEPARYAL